VPVEAVSGGRVLPGRAGVLPLRDAVAFPDLVVPLNIGQDRSVALVNDVLRGDRTIALIAGRDPEVEIPAPDQIYDVGVLGTVARMVRLPDDTLRVLVQATQRIRVKSWASTEPYLVAEIEEAHDIVKEGPQLTALMRNVQRDFGAIVGEVPYLPEELAVMVASVEDPVML
jgi:ATP-dependent Lon protease